MSVVFGWYSFKIKSYTVDDLNLDRSQWQNATFEVRQKVFHLFWIPFFSIGKYFAVRKQNKLYDVPDDIITKIKAKGKIRTPWYSFLLPILAITIPIFVGIYIYIAESIMKYNHFNEDKKNYENVIAITENELKKIQKNAYLHLINTTKNNRDEILYLKVVAIKDSKYHLLVKKINYPHYSHEKYYSENYIQDTLIFTKNEIEKAICKDYNIIEERKPFGINFFGNEKYIITNVEYFDEPVIIGEIDWEFWNANRKQNFYYNNNYRNNGIEITLNFQNFGSSTKLIEIKNLENNVKWIDSLPLQFDTYKYLHEIAIKGVTEKHDEKFKFKSLFIFKDSLNRKSEFIVEGVENYFTVNKK